MDKFALLRPRRPRGKAWIAVAAVVATAGTVVAIAAGALATTESVSAMFDATTVKNRTVKTCTGANGDSYEVTHATYTGTAVSKDSRLDGTIEIRVNSVYNTTQDLGRLEGKVHGDHVRGSLNAVNTNGTLEGFLKGGVHDAAGKLFANISAKYTSGGGFSEGELGTGSTENTAIIFSGGCGKAEGTTGLNGPKGASGPKGPKGTSGPKGPKGTSGPKGPKGASGHKGPKGATGPSGPSGASGPSGPHGPKK
jgi:hypothetical protein